MKNLADLRSDYAKASLDITDILADPIAQFNKWFHDALDARAGEPNAMNLATLSELGRPTARIVLLKGIENGCFVFYTNYQSQKGRELERDPHCALTFFWPELERQVRIEGIAARVSAAQSEAYFTSRPLGSQLSAWASPQSSVIANREILENRVEELKRKYEGLTVLPKPQQWGGYQVIPFEIEFWQGRPSRLHDRILYTFADDSWKINRLAP